jgi:hypothetical protein
MTRANVYRNSTAVTDSIMEHRGAAFMREEAAITVNGAKLTDAESMTVRVAIDTLANVLAEGLCLKEGEGLPLADRYMESLSRVQALLESREARRQ